VIAAAVNKQSTRTQLLGGRRDPPGSRTFVAQLEMVAGYKSAKRRTNEGGFVSIGTDITGLKTQRHFCQ